MDKADRQRLKQLANDSIIATFGRDDNEARLAVALEQCVDELEEIGAKCSTCSTCEDHGDFEPDDEDYPIYDDEVE